MEIEKNDTFIDAFAKDLQEGETYFSALCDELDALCIEHNNNAILGVLSKVQLWAIRYSRLPRVCRPVCLHYFKKYAKIYNGLVCFLFPPVDGTPMPIEELENIEL